MNFWKFSKSCSYKIKKLFFFTNLFSWNIYFSFWTIFYSGFYFDDLFSHLIKTISINILILPSFFLLEKWFSFWTGFGFFKYFLQFFSDFIFIDKLDFFFYLYLLLITIMYFILFFFILIFLI